MTLLNTTAISQIDLPWPVAGLEAVDRCPYCQSGERTLAHENLQDWSFYGAPGKWNYWACAQCESLYLDPRPTPATIGQAYARYYTHLHAGQASLVQRAKERLVNEFWTHALRVDVRPRLHLPTWLRGILLPLRSRLVEPFQLAELAKLPPGRLVDLGCGNGDMLVLARHLGWEAIGIELDPAAVQSSRVRSGAVVLEGSYPRLREYREGVDCIICSHVLEHVHDPLDMLRTIADALRPDGTLLLSLPNATSLLRQHFGDDWRGLEAPRHLSIPSMRQLTATLTAIGFRVRQRPLTRLWTATESFRIRRRGISPNRQDRAAARRLARSVAPTNTAQYDFVELVCTRIPAHA